MSTTSRSRLRNSLPDSSATLRNQRIMGRPSLLLLLHQQPRGEQIEQSEACERRVHRQEALGAQALGESAEADQLEPGRGKEDAGPIRGPGQRGYGVQ